jgi:hypothetical protein
MFHHTHSQFVQRGSSLEGDGVLDFFGHAVATSNDGTTIALTAHEMGYLSYYGGTVYDAAEHSGSGYVKVFDFNADVNDWELRGGPITPGVAARFDDFGAMVAMSGNGNRVAVVAARSDWRREGEEEGFIAVYDWNSDTSEWDQRAHFDLSGDVRRHARSIAMNDQGTFLVAAAITPSDHPEAQHPTLVAATLEGGPIAEIALLGSATSTVAVSADGRVVAHSNTEWARVWDTATSAWAPVGGELIVNRWNVATSAWEQMGEVLTGNGELEGFDGFGESVALSASGMVMAVGAAQSEHVEHAGSVEVAGGYVHVFDFDEGENNWVRRGAELAGDDGSYGRSVALSADGNVLAIGEYNHGPPYRGKGRVLVYSWDYAIDHEWKLVQSIGGEIELEEFGWSVALSDDGATLVVGARRGEQFGNWMFPDVPDSPNQGKGNVRVFVATPPSPPSPPPSPPSPPSPPHVDFRSLYSDYALIGTEMRGLSRSDFVGASVALSRDGTTLVFGAPQSIHFMTYDDTMDDRGPGYSEVHKFDADTQSWSRIGSRLEGDRDYQRHGHAVAINADGTRIAIGSAASYRFLGHVAVWAWDASSDDWARLGDDVVLDGQVAGSTYPGASDPTCGISVAMSDDGSLVAAGCVSHAGTGGAVQVFRWDEEGMAWQEHGRRLAEAHNGHMVALSDDGQVLAIGSPLNEVNGLNDAGDARVYAWEDGAWASRGDPLDGEAAQGLFGKSLALSADGGILAVGAPGYVHYSGCTDATDDTSCKGSVRVYAWDDATDAWAPRGDAIVGPHAASHLGESVALSATGDVLAIGSHGVNAGPSQVANDPRTREDEGHLEGRVYAWNAGISAWRLIGDGIDGGTDQGMNDVSSSVALSADGTRVAMGAWPFQGYHDFPELSEGVVRVYDAVEV